MKMVSAAKLKKAQDAITAMRPYSDKLTELIQNLSGAIGGDTPNPYTQERPVEKVLLIAITSNRACVGFNSNIIKAVNQYIAERPQQSIELVTLGKKGDDILSKSHTVKTNDNGIFEDLTSPTQAPLPAMRWNVSPTKNMTKLRVYNRFKNAATQVVTTETLLPIVASQEENNETTDYIFEPTQEEIVNELLPKASKCSCLKPFVIPLLVNMEHE